MNNESFRGKTGSLKFLKDLGFLVPEWSVIKHSHFVSWGSSEKWQMITLALQNNDHHSLTANLNEFLASIKIPQEISDFKKKFNFMAIRSSASVEDSPENSFAGIFESKLFINDDLEAAIKEVWASLFSAGALAYCDQRKIPWHALSMDVIIQEMVNGEKSGVLFQADPLGDIGHQIINAGYGLGQGIVDGLTETDRYLVSQYRVSKNDIQRKEKFTYFDKESRKVKQGYLSASQQESSVLTDNELKELIDASRKLDPHSDFFLDLEFTISKNRLYLLQARPITTVPSKKLIHLFDNSNIAENYPGQSLPLTFSILERGYAANFRNLIQFLGFPEAERKEIDNKLNHLVGYWGGQIYYNLNHWYEIYGLLPLGTKKATASFEDMAGIHSKSFIKEKERTSVHKLRILLGIIPSFTSYFFFTAKHHSQYKKHFSLIYQDLGIKSAQAKDTFSILSTIEELDRRYLAITKIPLLNDFFSAILNKICRQLVTHIAGNRGELLYNDLQSHRSELESSKAIYSLLALVETVTGNPSLLKHLQDLVNAGRSIEALYHNPIHQEFSVQLQEHFRRFGDRSQWEMKLETPTAREIPIVTIKLIIDYAEQGISKETQLKKEIVRSQNAEKELKMFGEKHPLISLLFWFTFKKCSQALCFREDARFDRVRIKGVFRQLSLNLGKALTQAKRLKQAEDIFYLTYDELYTLYYETYGDGYLAELVALRKKYLEKTKRLKLPDRIIVNNISSLNEFHENNEPFNKDSSGIPCSGGMVEAPCEVVTDLNQVPSLKGKILIAERTDPSWGYFFVGVSGIIIEKGSMLSHAAIISRELGIPCIINVPGATQRFKSGETIRMNGDTGIFEVIKK